MDIDWSHIADTPGYKSLKAAYIRDVKQASESKRPMRDKDEFLRLFGWVISRAKHYANHTGKPVEAILNEWEEKRDYWWLNYYQDCRQPKFHSDAKKPMGVNGIRKYYKSGGIFSSIRAKYKVDNFIRFQQKESSAKKKPRWTMARKKRGY